MAKVTIMGGGPAGLAAGYELGKSGYEVEVIEKENQVGGISKTVNFDGYYFDLGGHRFFTKSKDVQQTWEEVLGDDFLTRPRLSRIYYQNRFFNYPIKASNALMNLSPITVAEVLFSYAKVQLFPKKDEKTFEDWVSNRFGKRLYEIFFKTYTEKVWGIQCTQIEAEWAAQRIKGLSLSSAIIAALFGNRGNKIKTLIDEFQYPKYGPGMMYEKMAELIVQNNGKVNLEEDVIRINHAGGKVQSVLTAAPNGASREVAGDAFLSSIPITELIFKLDPQPPPEVVEAARGLTYRSILTVDLIINQKELFPDNWIYIHSPEVKLGRIQNFKNWSPYMVGDKNKTVLGLEYFCNEDDEFWKRSNDELIELGKKELAQIGLAKLEDIEKGYVVRVPKAYPVYMFGYKENLDKIMAYLNQFANLQPVGRYGMFKYNNMDHSILTGLYAARNIRGEKYNIWEVNTDDEYHEETKY